MRIEINKYNECKLTHDLSVDEELILLVFKELYKDEPFDISIAVKPLSMTIQHVRQLVVSLVDKGHMIRVNRYIVDLLSDYVEPIETDFIFSNDITINDKRMIVLLYKTLIGKDVIDTNHLHVDLPQELTVNLIDRLFEEGVLIHSLPLDFDNVFSLKSHYDA